MSTTYTSPNAAGPQPLAAPVQALSAADFLQLIWLASPALPIGGFSYSEGLESAVEQGHVSTETMASHWLQDQLELTLVRGDLAVVAQALVAWRAHQLTRIRQLNDWVLHTRETSELRAQTEQMGRSLLQWLRNDDGVQTAHLAACAEMPLTYPIAYALAASKTDAPVRECLLAFAFGWAENMVQALLKACALGQSAGQRILAKLSSAIPAAVATAMQLQDEQRQAFSPMLAILSSQHEAQYCRLFRS